MDETNLNNREEHDVVENVWVSFEKSVVYLKELASVYEETFALRGASFAGENPKKPMTITENHIEQARKQAQEALELLASNVLNASSSIMDTIVAQEDAAQQFQSKLQFIKACMKERQAKQDHQAINDFFQSAESTSTSSFLPQQESSPPCTPVQGDNFV